jgi:hypothetical protein
MSRSLLAGRFVLIGLKTAAAVLAWTLWDYYMMSPGPEMDRYAPTSSTFRPTWPES